MIQIKKIANANVYKRGVSFAGKAKEITLPDVSFIANEYKSLGLFGTPKLPDGLEAMEATFIWGRCIRKCFRKRLILFRPFLYKSAPRRKLLILSAVSEPKKF